MPTSILRAGFRLPCWLIFSLTPVGMIRDVIRLRAELGTEIAVIVDVQAWNKNS